MARYLISSTGKYNSWVLELCEDVVLIDAFLRLTDVIPIKQDQFLQEFSYYQFQKGTPINSDVIDKLESKFKIHRIEPLSLTETTVFEHARNRDYAQRAFVRSEIRDRMLAMDSDVRRRYVDENRAAKAQLPKPHYTAAEYSDWRRRERADRERSQQETRARLALIAHQKAEDEVKARALDADSAGLLLMATDDATLRQQILSRLDKAGRLGILAATQDQAIKNLVVASLLG